MRIVSNSGEDRVVDLLAPQLAAGKKLELATPHLSLFAFETLSKELSAVDQTSLLIPPVGSDLQLLGSAADRAARNRLQTRWLARKMSEWLGKKIELRAAGEEIPQATAVFRNGKAEAEFAIQGAFGLTTSGLGLTPGNKLNLIQASETETEATDLSKWFEDIWKRVPKDTEGLDSLLKELDSLSREYDPRSIYATTLHHLLGDEDELLDEERVVDPRTGIRESVVWQKLYRFQRDGVIGAIDKIEKHGGCIIADSVGLGKTFEALAVIKYHELRNDRVLVLCPKRLRENWTLYKANDQRNILAADRFNYDVLNHTDLSRYKGMSGDIDLSHISWGNYDLVVIDESHNFRNNNRPTQDRETRYDRLMKEIVQQGVPTRVLMLSATPVNNRINDLRNQISFATRGEDDALEQFGIASIRGTSRLAQKNFNAWMKNPSGDRTQESLIDALDFDYFRLLDLLTIARSRKHVEKYYGTDETGKFPTRLTPLNLKTEIDSNGEFPSIAHVNENIQLLNMAAYSPLAYVMPEKRDQYEKKYATEIRGKKNVWKQEDREKSMVNLMRVNMLKRMESSVSSFALTVGRQLEAVNALIAQLEDDKAQEHDLTIEDVDIDDSIYESLLIGKTIKVLVSDVDVVRWLQDLREDRDLLTRLHAEALEVGADRDAKLARLRSMIEEKVGKPINPGNRKILIFTHFADTADYLYENLASWARDTLGLQSALVTGGTKANKTTAKGIRKDFASLLSAFAPIAKELPKELAAEGSIDLIFATDCISEGQNLQDCDWVVNYDIHWNPVRLIQRFGRVDRIGSPNEEIQLVNFWPNMELEEYIRLEQKVSSKMKLLDISATGEENVIETESGDPMNDLDYRREQLLRLQEEVLDLEDLSNGISITDLTLTDFRIDLADYLRDNEEPSWAPMGAHAVTTTDSEEVPPGIIFCLRAEGKAAERPVEPGYPLAPHYLVHVGEDGAALLPPTQVKQTLDRIREISANRAEADTPAWTRFDKETKKGKDMSRAQGLLASAVSAVSGKAEERANKSIFSSGGTYATEGEFAGINDFEVLAFLVLLPDESGANG